LHTVARGVFDTTALSKKSHTEDVAAKVVATTLVAIRNSHYAPEGRLPAAAAAIVQSRTPHTTHHSTTAFWQYVPVRHPQGHTGQLEQG